MTPEGFVQLIKRLGHAYGHSMPQLDTEAMDTWFDFLKPYPDAIAAAAVVHMVRTVPKFPSLAQLIQIIEANHEITADEAWEEAVEKAYRLNSPIYIGGKPQPVEFTDPLVKETLESIGVDHLLNAGFDELNTMKAQFRRVYESKKQKRTIRETTQAITGSQQNNLLQFPGMSQIGREMK